MVIKVLNIFMILTLLNINSCGSSMNMMGKNGLNGDLYKKNGENSETQSLEEALCPLCQGADRHFYKLTNGTIIIYCEECSSYWLDPENISSRGAVNRYGLEKRFSADICELFDEKGKSAAHWATVKEVQASEWKGLAPTFIRSY